MRYFLLALVLFFSACSTKIYEHTQTKIISIKTPKLRFSDLGYIKNTDDKISVELFTAGKMVQNIKINYLICVDAGCMSKSAFNKAYLNASYPKDILENIVLGDAIYDKKNLHKEDGGFVQYIKDKNVNIKYKVTADTIYFKDKKNSILFKIRNLQ